jgi:hypothetical protein
LAGDGGVALVPQYDCSVASGNAGVGGARLGSNVCLGKPRKHNEGRRFLYASWKKVPKSSFHSKNSDFVAGRPIDTPGTPLLALNLRPFLLLCSLFPSCEKTQEWGRDGGGETVVERRGGTPSQKIFFFEGFWKD